MAEQAPYITDFTVEGYRCIQKATLKLTPFHALIGPNDSGKSTLLAALGIGNATLLSPPDGLAGVSTTTDAGLFACEVGLSNAGSIATRVLPNSKRRILVSDGDRSGSIELNRGLQSGDSDVFRAIHAPIARGRLPARRVHFEPSALRQTGPLIPGGRPLEFGSAQGSGLASILDAVTSRDIDAFIKIRDRVREFFPAVRNVSLRNSENGTKEIWIDLQSGASIPAAEMSEGLLLFLAYSALQYLEPTSLLLIEEPENGLHPARIVEVMRMLRGLSTTTQIVIATHSPLVLNEMRPEEITVVTRTVEHGTRATPLSETTDFAARSRAYALGDLWVTFANGDDESGLVSNSGT